MGSILGVALAAFVPAAAMAPAQQQLPPLLTADAMGQQIFAATGSTGVVLVVVRDGDVYMQSYGETAPGNGQKPDAHTLLRLCSLSKIIATDLLARLVADHTVNFTDTLQQFAPRGVVVPTQTVHGKAIRGITLGDLATHTSGLPREVLPSPRGVPTFTFPDRDQRWRWLPRQNLLSSPGTAALYSNVGFDFLGDALAQATGMAYEEIFRERLGVPLVLVDTTLTPSQQQCMSLMIPAHHASRCADTDASGGSSGMYSTAADMTRWLQYLLGLPGVPQHQNPAAQAMYLVPGQLQSVQGLDHAGDPSGIGLGWIRIGLPGDPGMIVQKTGGGGGFSTYIALNPAHHTGIFLAATDGPVYTHTHMFQQVNNMLTVLSGLPPLPPPPPDPLPAAPRPHAAHTTRSASGRVRSETSTRHASGKARTAPAPHHTGRPSRRPPTP